MSDTLNTIRTFGMANMLTEVSLDRVEQAFAISLNRPSKKTDEIDSKYYPQFEQRIREEAAQMARHYEIFYCLEKSIRSLISQRLLEEYKENWWEEKVPEFIRVNAKKLRDQEIAKG